MLTPLIDSLRNESSWNSVSLNKAVFWAEEAETAVVERISEAYPARLAECEQRIDFPRGSPIVLGGLFDAHSEQLQRTPGVAVEKRLCSGVRRVTRDGAEQDGEDPYGPTHVHGRGPGASASNTSEARISPSANE